MTMEEGARYGGLPELGPAGGGADLISPLPDYLLLQVLASLRCARAAARTSLLSRRWSRLWSHLASFTFRDVELRLLRPALDSLVYVPDVSLLDVHVPEAPPLYPPYQMLYVADIASTVRAAAALSPVELRFSVSRGPLARPTGDMLFLPPPVILPGFHRATSIDLSGLDLFLSAANPPASRCMFPELEVLSLSGCLVDAAALLLHCPRLRVLRATGCSLGHAIRSASLQVLLLENKHKSTSRVHIDVPGLKQLNLSIHTRGELRLSISAPMVEKALWRCCYSKAAAGIGPWGLAMGSFSFPQTGLSLAQEIEKHLVVTTFNVLDLHFNTTGHAFGAFVFHLLRIDWILTATKSLKIELGKKGKACPINCPCDEPGNWRSETILLINLEEVEIRAFGGEDYDFDFLRLILKCAPRLKRMTVRPSDDVNDDWCTKVYDILKVYPSVECNVFPN
ncbi:hypothetical protein D1007_33448 [Hordeum vulgare]|nr:hypothetical protein D1007_33448 [Hordeum vulgare]